MAVSGQDFDVIIVGAGIMGSCTAYQVAKRGHKTLLIEQFDFLHHRGSSHGESRTIRATYPEDYYYAMVMESYKLWEEAESEIGYKVYFKARHLDMGASDDKSVRGIIDTCIKHSVPHEVLDPRLLAEKFSGMFNIPENCVGVSNDYGGVIKPTKAVSMFQTLALQKGAVLRDCMEVKDIRKDGVKGGIWVYTSNGEKFWGKKCVVTVGAWTRKLVKRVRGVELPIQPLETTVCYWRIKEGHEAKYRIGGDFPTFAYYGEPYIYGTPSLEFPGLIKVAVHGGYPCDQDKRPWGPGIAFGSLKQWIEEKLAGQVDSAAGPAATQLCMYSMSPDEDFVIDFLGGEFGKDVVIGGGFSGHGFKMGPVVGRILADLVLGGEAKGVELKHFRMGRFEENPKGNVKNFLSSKV
ncbi:probable sarcosine oxidase [Juglans microcarpa x Juglans regia]|uniref:probable sarcosine oxidase n=1 Tax=Juglans microcarpa x Juglans regia TaxID=2249226 RepID=UPI001B7F293B|nr:probable sarcosine oxidase [Juglans microcarpa x Juglans regia]